MKAFLRKTFQNFKKEVLFTKTFFIVLAAYLLFSLPLLYTFIVNQIFQWGFMDQYIYTKVQPFQFIQSQWFFAAGILNMPLFLSTGVLLELLFNTFHTALATIPLLIFFFFYVFVITSILASFFVWNKKVGWSIVGLIILAVGGYLFTELYRVDNGKLVCKETFPCAGGWERVDMPYCSGIGYQCKSGSLNSITNFDECVAAGNPVQESYPARCTTVTGYTYTQEIKE